MVKFPKVFEGLLDFWLRWAVTENA